MVAVIAGFTVVEGQADAFENIARTLVAKVTANEPGAPLNKPARATKGSNSFAFMELDAARKDLKAPGETDCSPAALPEMKPLLPADPVIGMLDEVA